MGKGPVFVSIAVALAATAVAARERHRRKEMEALADYFYDELYQPTAEELMKAEERLWDLDQWVEELLESVR